MKKIVVLLVVSSGFFGLQACKKKGCTDPVAINYDEKAEKDNGKCEYAPETIIDGDVNSPLSFSNQTVKICGNVNVNSTLTFGEGTNVIMCADAELTIKSSGSLNSTGTAAKPVYIRGESPTKGYWRNLTFESASSNNQIVYTNISDGGGYWYYEYAGVFLETNSSVTFQNSRISNMKDYGLYVKEGCTLPNFNSNVFENINGYGVRIMASQYRFLDAASTYNNLNSEPYVLVKGNTVGGNVTWIDLNQSVLLTNTTEVTGNLTIAQGAAFKMEAQSAIDVNSTGSLSAIGTLAELISFTGKSATPGYWTGIVFSSNNASNRLHYCDVRDGGYDWYYEYSSIYVSNSSRADIYETEVSNSNNYGLFRNNSGSVYNNSTLVTTYAGLTTNNYFFGNGAGGSANCTTCATNIP